MLTNYNGTNITYDAIGNPLSDGTWVYTWEEGRKLAKMSRGSTTWTYAYDANGMRTKRINGSTTYNYIYHGDQLTHMTYGSNVLHFYYDASGKPLSVVYNGTTYYYVLNLQGDVVALLDSSGNQVVGYSYDAWGKPLTLTGSKSSTLGLHNPLRYRGYVYDWETELYYLQSRYYNPEIGRFINADDSELLFENYESALQYNLFVYCWNNPINKYDPDGYWVLSLTGGGCMAAAGAAGATNVWNPVGWVILGVTAVFVVAIIVDESVKYSKEKDASTAVDRVTGPIGRRNDYNSRKEAKEAAKRAGGGKEPINHPKGSHGNKKSHYHPNVKEKYRVTPHGSSLHDHYYYPR